MGQRQFAVRTRSSHWLARSYIFCFVCFLAQALQIPAAHALPPGELVDLQPLESDDSLFCSSYLNKGKVAAILSRADGKKHLKKSFWTMTLVKQQILSLSDTIKKLSRGPKAKVAKKLRIAKEKKKAFASMKLVLTKCAKGQDNNKVLFKHVQGTIETQCMNCHGVLGWENTENFFLRSGRVDKSGIEASPLYTFLSNNPQGFQPGYMPKGLAPLSEINTMMLARWIESLSSSPAPTPIPSGPIAEGQALYATNCASCHGAIGVSAKWGKSAAQIKAAIGSGVPQMSHLNLNDDQIGKIAGALALVQPPVEGTVAVRSVGSVAEGNPGGATVNLQFEVILTGSTSAAFSVGYVTSNGTALADSDYRFTSGTLQFQGFSGEKKTINVQVLSDTIQEGDESVYVDVGGVSHGGVRVATSTASGTIINDDVFVQNLPPLPAKLRLAYGFNGNYTDAMGLSDAAPQGDAVISTSSKIGSGAVELDEGTDHLLVPNRNLGSLTDFSLATWVNWQNSTSTTSRVFDFGSSTSNYVFFAPKDSGNRCRFEIRSASGTFTLQCITGVALPANAWVHVVTTFDSVRDEMKIFFDGVQVATRTGVTLAMSSLTLSDNKIGKSRVTGSTDFSGRIDELSVWDAVLTPEQIGQVKAMTQTISVNSGIEVRINNQLLPNSSVLDLGSVVVGDVSNFSLLISNGGTAGLALPGQPVVQIGGRNSSEFIVKHQPWPWQQLLGAGSFASFSLRYAPTHPGSKIATLMIPNSDQQNGNFATSLTAAATGDPLPEPPAPGNGDSPLTVGQYLYAANCSSCHGILAQSQKTGATNERITGALDPNTGIPQMRGLGMTSDQIQKLVLALNSPAPQTGSADKVRTSIVNIGTGAFVASVFSNVFLPDNPATFTTDDNTINTKISENILGRRTNGTFITGRISSFGGRCDRFEDSCQTEAQRSSQRPSPSALRSGLILRTCDDILSIDRSVQNVLTKIGRSSTAPVDALATKDIFQLFFPGQDMPQYLAEVTSNFSRGLTQFSQLDHWRFQVHLICTSNDWENL